MKYEQFYDLLLKHKGKVIGSLLGFIFSIFVIVVGFFNTIFIMLCILGGLFIGSKLDNKEDLVDILNRILPPNNKIH
jgi:uncharacterized membrane protein